MAYNKNGLSLLKSVQAPGDNPFNVWVYKSTDPATAVRVAGYITDGSAKGMLAGDVVYSVKTDASPISVQIHIVSAVTAGGSADLSDGLAITATNTD